MCPQIACPKRGIIAIVTFVWFFSFIICVFQGIIFIDPTFTKVMIYKISIHHHQLGIVVPYILSVSNWENDEQEEWTNESESICWRQYERHSKVSKFATKIALRQNSVNYHHGTQITHCCLSAQITKRQGTAMYYPLPAVFKGFSLRREKFTRQNFTLPTIHLGPAEGRPGPVDVNGWKWTKVDEINYQMSEEENILEHILEPSRFATITVH